MCSHFIWTFSLTVWSFFCTLFMLHFVIHLMCQSQILGLANFCFHYSICSVCVKYFHVESLVFCFFSITDEPLIALFLFCALILCAEIMHGVNHWERLPTFTLNIPFAHWFLMLLLYWPLLLIKCVLIVFLQLLLVISCLNYSTFVTLSFPLCFYCLLKY